VKDTVLARGYCANDTTILYVTDTLETIDTMYQVYVDTLVINDSVVFWETKFHTITKVRTIRDSIKSVVVDSSMVGVLRKELLIAKEYKSWKKMFFLSIGASILFFLLLFKLK
jgi:hypothetical protein